MFYDRNVLFCTLPQNLRYKVQSTVQVHVQVQGRTSLTYEGPCDIKKDIPKDEADELKTVFEKLGAVMEIL